MAKADGRGQGQLWVRYARPTNFGFDTETYTDEATFQVPVKSEAGANLWQRLSRWHRRICCRAGLFCDQATKLSRARVEVQLSV